MIARPLWLFGGRASVRASPSRVPADALAGLGRLAVPLDHPHGESRDDPDAFESVLTFATEGAATRIEMRTVFPTQALRDEAVETYHAVEGGRQTLDNLAAYVTEMVRKGGGD
jgi:hypothetical protein